MSNIRPHTRGLLQSEEELTSTVGEPGEIARNKEIAHLDHHCVTFIERSPLVFLGTADETGRCDVSPRGGDPGLVKILGANQLLIPDAPGNQRVDSMKNILRNPHVGLLFLIPGLGETLRVNGTAIISREPELLHKSAANPTHQQLVIVVAVQEAFLHCAKALIRSAVWRPTHWPSTDGLARPAQIWKDHAELGLRTSDVQQLIDADYENAL